MKLPVLRDEWEEAIAAWNSRRRGVVVMPTGTGKTEVALALMRDTAVSTLIVAPVRDLMYQWHRRIQEGLGYDGGVIGDSVFRVQPVSVTTYDSACIHMERLGSQFALIIFDECLHLPGDRDDRLGQRRLQDHSPLREAGPPDARDSPPGREPL